MSPSGWWVLLWSLSGILAIPATADCLKPVLHSIFPPELQMGADREFLPVTLFGEDLGFDPVWQNPAESSRCHSRILVRRKGEGEDGWVVVPEHPGSDAEGLVLGEGSHGWVRIDLKTAVWTNSTRSLEFVVIRGAHRDDGSFQETGRSVTGEVAVVEAISYGLEIRSLNPPSIRPGSPGVGITMEGVFNWESGLYLNGTLLPDASIHPGRGTASVQLSGDRLARPGSLVFSLRDPAGAVSNEVVFYVDDPTAISRISPRELKSGRDRASLRIRFEGAEPERIEIRFQPRAGTIRAATAPQQEDFTEGFSKGTQTRSDVVAADSMITVWRPVAFEIRRNEVRFAVDSEFLSGPGTLIVRLSGRTGEQAAVIQVSGEENALMGTKAPLGGPPEKDHPFTDRPRY